MGNSVEKEVPVQKEPIQISSDDEADDESVEAKTITTDSITFKQLEEKFTNSIAVKPHLAMNMLFANNWSVDSSNLLSDNDFNFSSMIDFPFDEYNSWRVNGKDYNRNGIGTGEPNPKYKLVKLNIFDIKYMTATLYNNGSFNHKSLIITREPNILINNNMRLKLCSLINTISTRIESMDYRYSRKLLLQKVVVEYKKYKNEKWRSSWICCKCWSQYSDEEWSNELQKHFRVNMCPECGEKRISMKMVENKYLIKNNANKYDEYEFDLFKQRINDIIDPLLDSDKNWIPSVFIYDKNSKQYKIKKHTLNENLFYIDKCYKELYHILGCIFTKIVPMFEWVLDLKIDGIYDKLNVIISIQDYQLKPNEIYQGRPHREGYKEENIVGAAVYYFDFTHDMIGDDIFEIHATFNGVYEHTKKPCHYNYGRVYHQFNIKEGIVLVFNNDNINHSLKKLQNISKQSILHRKIVVFMLVNPNLNKTPQTISLPSNKCNINGNYNINHYDDCKQLIDSIIFAVFGVVFNNQYLQFPKVIKNIIIRYVIDNIEERRKNRNTVRFKRFMPTDNNGQAMDIKSYSTPWVGFGN